MTPFKAPNVFTASEGLPYWVVAMISPFAASILAWRGAATGSPAGYHLQFSIETTLVRLHKLWCSFVSFRVIFVDRFLLRPKINDPRKSHEKRHETTLNVLQLAVVVSWDS